MPVGVVVGGRLAEVAEGALKLWCVGSEEGGDRHRFLQRFDVVGRGGRQLLGERRQRGERFGQVVVGPRTGDRLAEVAHDRRGRAHERAQPFEQGRKRLRVGPLRVRQLREHCQRLRLFGEHLATFAQHPRQQRQRVGEVALLRADRLEGLVGVFDQVAQRFLARGDRRQRLGRFDEEARERRLVAHELGEEVVDRGERRPEVFGRLAQLGTRSLVLFG